MKGKYRRYSDFCNKCDCKVAYGKKCPNCGIRKKGKGNKIKQLL